MFVVSKLSVYLRPRYLIKIEDWSRERKKIKINLEVIKRVITFAPPKELSRGD